MRKIVVINKDNCQKIDDSVFVQLNALLSDLNKEYPFFDGWLRKVFLEVQTTYNRFIIVCFDQDNNQIIGIAILKKSQKEKKICTLRVICPYKRQGVGTELLKKSIEILNDSQPLITVSELHIDEFLPFLRKHGFVLKNKVKSIYNKGIYEYFFNTSYKHKYVLLSIHPMFTAYIIGGNKTIEFRKKIFSDTVERVYVYSTSPEGRIVGYFEITKIVEDTPVNLWLRYSEAGCISKKDFFEYYKDCSKGTGIIISNFRKFVTPLNPKYIDSTFKAPQSYCYIDNVEIIKWLSRERASLIGEFSNDKKTW